MDREKAEPEVKNLSKSKKYIDYFHRYGAKSTHKHPFVCMEKTHGGRGKALP